MTQHAKNVIVGAGVMGLATAYHLARRGEPVLLIEQFALGHDRGSSHGAARITRHSYADIRYARLMPAAFAAWRELEAACGQSLYVRTGGVSLCPPSVDYVAKVASALEAIECPHRRMTGRELNAAWPIFSVPEDHDTVFEPDAGMILAARAIQVMLHLTRTLGGDRVIIRENSPVRRIDLDGDHPTLVLDDATVTADRLIVTAGSWVGTLLPEFAERLIPERQQVLYLAPDNPDAFAIGKLPVFISYGDGPTDKYYGMPGVLGLGIKVARHGGERIDPDIDARHVGEVYREEVRMFLRGCMPSLADAPVSTTEICKYTVAPNEDFVLGPHPKRPDVIVVSPCSGHGFKFAALIGGVLADLAMIGKTDVDIVLCCRP